MRAETGARLITDVPSPAARILDFGFWILDFG